MIHAQYVKSGGKTIWLFPAYWKRMELPLCIQSFRMAFAPCIARYVWSDATQQCPRWPAEASQHRRGGPAGTEASSGVDFQWRAGSSAASFHCQFTINFAALTWNTLLTPFVRFVPTCTDQSPWAPAVCLPASCAQITVIPGTTSGSQPIPLPVLLLSTGRCHSAGRFMRAARISSTFGNGPSPARSSAASRCGRASAPLPSFA